MTAKTAAFVVSFIALSAMAMAQNNPNYSALVDTCLTEWKGCLGTSTTGINLGQCLACVQSCGRQDISTPPDGTLCSQLRDHCRTLLFNKPPGPTCQSPTCVNNYTRCQFEGPSSIACRTCGSACKTCPELYRTCVGSLPPVVAPGTCPNEGCSYYEKQCTRSPGTATRFCGDCKAACIGVRDCEKEFGSCGSANV